MSKRGIDWDPIRTEYISTSKSYARLAAEYGVSRSEVEAHGKHEQWVEQRRQYQCDIRAKMREEAQERGLAALRRSGRIAELALDRAEELLGEPGGLNGTQLCAAVDALRGAVAIIHDVYGLPTVEQQHRQEIDRERLALEREKAHIGTDGGEASGFVIEIEGDDGFSL